MEPQDHPEILALREQVTELQRELDAANAALADAVAKAEESARRQAWTKAEAEAAVAREAAEEAAREQTKEQKHKQRFKTLLIAAYLVTCCLDYWGIVGAMVDCVSTGQWRLKPNPTLPLDLLDAAFVLLRPLAVLFFAVTAAGLVGGVGYASWSVILSIARLFGRRKRND